MRQIVVSVVLLGTVLGCPIEALPLRLLPGAGWQALGPAGGLVKNLAYHATRRGEAWALLDADTSSILYRTTNDGRSWSRLHVFDGVAIDVALDPFQPDTCYVLTYYELNRTTDNGRTWSPIALKEGYGGGFNGLLLDTHTSGLIYVAGFHWTDLAAGRYCMSFMKSGDSGLTWQTWDFQDRSYAGQFQCIAADPEDPRTLYVGGVYQNSDMVVHPALYKSTDGGKAWKRITGQIDGFLSDLVLDPATPSRVYVSTLRAVYRSADGGRTWKVNKGCGWGFCVAIDPADSNIIYVGATNKISRSTDGGVNWAPYEGVFGGIGDIVISGSSILAGSSGGMYRSTDRGGTWAGTNAGIKATHVTSICSAPSAPRTVYAACFGSGIFGSSDSGSTWKRLPYPGRLDGIKPVVVVHPKDPNTVYGLTYEWAGVGAELYKSRDAGQSWTKVYGASVDHLVIDPKNPNRILAAGRGAGWTSDSPALHESVDGGATWVVHELGVTDTYVTALAVDPRDTRIVYLGGGDGSKAIVYRTRDGGKSWTNATGSITGYEVQSIDCDPRTSGVLYAAVYAGGVFRSQDGGESWVRVSYDDLRWVKASPLAPRQLYAGGPGGVFVSSDQGTTWAELGDDLPFKDVISFEVDAENKLLLAGTAGGGAWRRDASVSTPPRR
ncbi:MAG: hypothetical protein HYX75_03770 [Acidobacteria bacterium]|nr:hypothetical protein [Acidobacteriota bacterium]